MSTSATLLTVIRYLDNECLWRDEWDGQKRGESKQEHADRISAWIQENEDLRATIEEVRALAAMAPT